MIEDGVEDLPLAGRDGPASAGRRREEGLKDLPLSIGQVGVVGAPGLGGRSARRTLWLDLARHRRGGLPGVSATDPSTSASMKSDGRKFSQTSQISKSPLRQEGTHGRSFLGFGKRFWGGTWSSVTGPISPQ